MKTLLFTCDCGERFCGLYHNKKHIIGAMLDSDTLEVVQQCLFINNGDQTFSAFNLETDEQEWLFDLSVDFVSESDFAWEFKATKVLQPHLRKYATYTYGGKGLIKNCVPLYYRGGDNE